MLNLKKIKPLLKNAAIKLALSQVDFSGKTILAEFPKCGGSYLSLVLACILESQKYHIIQPSNYTIHYFVSDIDQNSFLSNLKSPKNIVVKTHQPFIASFKNIICLLRNPIDCMCSYYRHLAIRNKIPKGYLFQEFVKHPRYGISAYIKFYNSYLLAPYSSSIAFVDYQHLISEPYATICKLLAASYGIDPSSISDVIRQSLTHNLKHNYMKRENYYIGLDFRRLLNQDDNSFYASRSSVFIDSDDYLQANDFIAKSLSTQESLKSLLHSFSHSLPHYKV